ncbi:MAG: HIRAN domain-containing protein [Burkholderiales bacterium]|jgi:hypothetical protein
MAPRLPFWLAATVLALCLACAHAAENAQAYLLVQICFVSDFAQHDGKSVFRRLKRGALLQLVREPDNEQDGNAVRVEWQGHWLGYLPASVNAGIARQLDFGNRLRARITRLSRHRDPDRRVEIEIIAPL